MGNRRDDERESRADLQVTYPFILDVESVTSEATLTCKHDARESILTEIITVSKQMEEKGIN